MGLGLQVDLKILTVLTCGKIKSQISSNLNAKVLVSSTILVIL